MAASLDLNRAKENLSQALGDRMKQYTQNMNLWFKQKRTREHFDLEARKMLKSDEVHLHNEFLLSILTKCQTFTPTLAPKDMNTSTQPVAKLIKKGTKFKKRTMGRSLQKFQPVDPISFVPKEKFLAPAKETNITFCSREMCLPDATMVCGRMFLSAWEANLENVTDDAVNIVMEAVEVHLKNTVSCAIHRRKGFHLREGRFKYGGGDVVQPYLRNTSSFDEPSEPTSVTSFGVHIPSIKPSIEMGQGDAAKHMACSGQHITSTRPLNLYDLFDSLQVHRHVIPSHTVYSLCMERVISRLWHPSREEMNQENNKQDNLQKKLASS